MSSNKSTFIKKIQYLNNEFLIFHTYKPHLKNINVSLKNENIVTISSSLVSFNSHIYTNYNIESLIFKLLERANKKAKKVININLSYSADNHQIVLFGRPISLIWNYNPRLSHSFKFDEINSQLTIYCNQLLKINDELRKKVFLYTLKRILEKYIASKQFEYTNKINNFGVKINNPLFSINLKNTAWGTNYKKHLRTSKIIYDVKMIALDEKFIDTIILHELVHEIHRNHSDAFYNFGNMINENFKDLNKQINKIIVSIIQK
ncbi:YgjP-like metallopeptidase domain-containing protein [Mycoplasma tauri]|uniref:YgjP-like metallopeptidase domain-containing protein n=1 Tax=Mycoplasma tauri TaxID=547987 RepID=UPI001CBDE5E0|nr:YgjP-like metallopeptidase domain-containing protein [Mycoplasma tauri]MBZ4203638.1 M48 family metallopeptidase [Mycoplasma tauri]